MTIRRTRCVLAATAIVAGLALAAPAAEAAPIVTFQCSPAPSNCLGWYRTNVTITWTIQPSDATRTGCVNDT
jgi:type IV secretory pathway protease TraF